MSNLVEEINKRRTFAIISHPDAGKTTLTEKLLLYGGAITAGLSFVAPFWIKLYDLLIDGPLRGSSMTRWLQKTWKTDQSSDNKQAN